MGAASIRALRQADRPGQAIAVWFAGSCVLSLASGGRGEAGRPAVLDRVHRTGPLAVRVVRGIALLGDAADIYRLSQLSGVGTEPVERVIRVLGRTGVLIGTRFREDAARAAILDDIPFDAEVALRYQAARVLYHSGGSVSRVAEHMLKAGPRPDDWAAAVLQDAARRAVSDDQIGLATRYLEFATACCTDAAQRIRIEVRLADLCWRLSPAASARRLVSLKAAVLAGRLAGSQALAVVLGLLWHLRLDEAAEVIDHLDIAAGHSLGDAERQLIGKVLTSSYPGLLARVRNAPSAEAHGGGWDADQIAHAVSGNDLSSDTFHAVTPAIARLIYAGRLDAASDWCRRLLTAAGKREAPTWRSCLLGYRALISLRQGFFDAAVSDAERALACWSEQDWHAETGLVIATLVEAHTAIGNHHSAAGYLARPVPAALFQTRIGLHYLHARGTHYLATSQPLAALTDFMSCGDKAARWDMDSPSVVPWRRGVAAAQGSGRAGGGAFAKLSAAERRVALLAADGLTNSQIGAKLFITASTVEQHLTRTYRKLEITSRAQLAVLAHPCGLISVPHRGAR